MLLTESAFTLASLLESGTTVLTWFITAMGSVLNFMTSNSALLIWLIVSLIGAACIFLRKFI